MSAERILLDPTHESSPAERPALERPSSLQGLRVGLLDIKKARGDIFLDRLEKHLDQQGASVLRYTKPTFTKPAPLDLRKKIAEECAAVVEALAD